MRIIPLLGTTALTLTLAACGSTGPTTSPGNPDRPAPMSVVVTAPQGVNPNVVVTGPSYSRVFTQPGTYALSDARPGSYTVTARTVTTGSLAYVPVASGTINVPETGSVAARAAYDAVAPVSASLAALGDSITRGQKLSDPGRSWPRDVAVANQWTLAGNLNVSGSTPGNFGIDGSTVASGSKGYAPMVDRYRAVLQGNPGHVTVMGGSNDYTANIPLGPVGSTDPTTFHGAARLIVRGLLDNFKGRVFVITPIWRGDTGRTEGTPNGLGLTLDHYRKAWRDVVADVSRSYPSGRLVLVDAGQDLKARFESDARLMSADRLHPSDAGDDVIAQYVGQYVVAQITQP